MNHRRPMAARILAVVPSFAAGATLAQQPAASLIAPLRSKATFTADDSKLISTWIAALVADHTTAVDKAKTNADAKTAEFEKSKADAAFRQAFSAELTAANATDPFRVRLSEQAGDDFKTLFATGKALDVHLARTLAQTLYEMNRVGTIDGLTAGLTFPDAEVRYHCAKAFMELRSKIQIDARLMTLTIQTLEAAGKDEKNPVVLKRIYEAIAFRDPAGKLLPASLATTLEVFTTRIARWKAGPLVIDDGDVPAFVALRTQAANLTPAQSVPLVGSLAVLLRLDVQRYAQAPLPAVVKFLLGYRICLTEDLLDVLVGAKPNPDIRAALARDVGKDMLDALNLWIGTDQKPGILNATPWNVAVGAP